MISSKYKMLDKRRNLSRDFKQRRVTRVTHRPYALRVCIQVHWRAAPALRLLVFF